MSESLLSADDVRPEEMPAKLRLMAVAGRDVCWTMSADAARNVARVLETGMTAAADQERILAQAEAFRAKGLGAAREVLGRAEARHAQAERMLIEARARLRAAQWLLASATVIAAALLAVMFGP
jgi:hypothetical protein